MSFDASALEVLPPTAVVPPIEVMPATPSPAPPTSAASLVSPLAPIAPIAPVAPVTPTISSTSLAPIPIRPSEPLHTADWLDLGDLASPWTEIPEVRARTGAGEALSSISGVNESLPPPVLKSTAQDLFEDTAVSWLEEEAKPQRGAAEQALFDDESEFFDLAAELEQELATENARRAGQAEPEAREQSLEEIVEGFKKGVAEHLSPRTTTPTSTSASPTARWASLDEAIGEFQLAAKAPQHLLICCSMLGLCFLDKGLPELAVKWYRRALEVPDLTEEQQPRPALRPRQRAGGRPATATRPTRRSSSSTASTANYRDVVTRIEELEPA